MRRRRRCSCLTAAQVSAAKKIYRSAVNPRTRQVIFPGMLPGSESTWGALAGGPRPFTIPADFFRYFVFGNPEWDWRRMDFDKDVAAVEAKNGAMFNAVDPDLRRSRLVAAS